ncbi:MAG: tRNA-(ms[2]io[6]A)-hydroxylase [bacterium]|nr:tRNA-(ms[2]io[6]A)-hydroxylase [bacterium]
MQENQKTKLGLQMATDPRWVNIAEMNIEEILSDHAWCEQKAATTGISLIVKYAYVDGIIDKVTPIVEEEWAHFRMVIEELKKRNLKLLSPRKDEYVKKLFALEKMGLKPKEVMVEKLLISAMIEARSCERFRLLSIHIQDEGLKAFYREFMESEAGHYHIFIHLAKTILPADYVMKRWEEFLLMEADIMRSLELRGDRIH